MRMPEQKMVRSDYEKVGNNTGKLRKGLWSPEEEEKLMSYMLSNGQGCWTDIARNAGLIRCGKSCRLRWINYLRPDLKRGAFSTQEEALTLHLHSILGKRWSQIAARLPERTDYEIKNFWNLTIKWMLKNNNNNNISTSSPPKNSFDDSSSDLQDTNLNVMGTEGLMFLSMHGHQEHYIMNTIDSSSTTSSSSSTRKQQKLRDDHDHEYDQGHIGNFTPPALNINFEMGGVIGGFRDNGILEPHLLGLENDIYVPGLVSNMGIEDQDNNNGAGDYCLFEKKPNINNHSNKDNTGNIKVEGLTGYGDFWQGESIKMVELDLEGLCATRIEDDQAKKNSSASALITKVAVQDFDGKDGRSHNKEAIAWKIRRKVGVTG